MAETAVPLATLGVQDPELRSSAGRPVAAAGDERLGPLADDVAAEPDPAASLELEAEAGRFGDRGREAGRQARRLEGDEERLRPPGEAGQAPEPLGDLRRRRAHRRTRREVDHEDVDRAPGEEHAGDRQALVEGVGSQDDEPVEADAAGGGLDRVERPGKIEPGDDRAVGLSLGDEAEGEGRGPGAGRAAQRDAGGTRQPARSEDRVEGREAGPDDPLDASSRIGRERRRGQRSDHPRSCGTPPRLERRESSRDVRGEAGHRTLRLEHTFDIVNDLSVASADPFPARGAQHRPVFREGLSSVPGRCRGRFMPSRHQYAREFRI